MLLVAGLLILAFGLGFCTGLAGVPEPPGPPASTLSHTLDDIYNRLDKGTEVAQRPFTEPGSGPGAGTGHTLDEIYDLIGMRAPVPRTGSVFCYTVGGDGDLQRGVAWPNPRFTKNGDGSVTDNLTGLIWLEDANCIKAQYPTYDKDDTDGDGRVTWPHAVKFVAGINVGTYSNCGASHTGWRPPNVRELASPVHYGVSIPAIPDTDGTGRWSEGNPFTGV
jgi:hypothetical protein